MNLPSCRSRRRRTPRRPESSRTRSGRSRSNPPCGRRNEACSARSAPERPRPAPGRADSRSVRRDAWSASGFALNGRLKSVEDAGEKEKRDGGDKRAVRRMRRPRGFGELAISSGNAGSLGLFASEAWLPAHSMPSSRLSLRRLPKVMGKRPSDFGLTCPAIYAYLTHVWRILDRQALIDSYLMSYFSNKIR